MTIKNNTNKDIDFEVEKGQIIETNPFKKVQNLAIIGIIKLDPSKQPTKWELEAMESRTFTIKANSEETIGFNCLCIDQCLPSPTGEKYAPTAFKSDKASKQSFTMTGALPNPDDIDLEDIYQND